MSSLVLYCETYAQTGSFNTGVNENPFIQFWKKVGLFHFQLAPEDKQFCSREIAKHHFN